MQVNAINSFSNVNFEGRKAKKAEKKNSEIQQAQPSNNRFMSKLSGPVAAALFLVPAATLPTSCDKIEVSASAGIEVPIYPPCPPQDDDVNLDWSVQDSLLTWGNDYLAIPIEGLYGDKTNKALRYAEGKRQWDFNRPESIELNIPMSNAYETRYDHIIGDDIKNDIRITKVAPGELTIVRQDGTMTDDISGLMFNEDGVKTFAHSNGRDSIYVYPKAMSGDNEGKYVYRGTVGRGYLYKDEYGDNVLLVGFLSPADENNPPTEDHYIEVAGEAITKEEIADSLNNDAATKSEEDE